MPVVLGSLLAACVALANFVGVLATGSSTTIDTSSISELLNLCKQCMGLFTEFPLNIFLIGGLVGIGFGIFKAAKRAARS
ncbi:MAG: hypothetical protein HDR25_01465 [Lachnospiraceae bacterium]|nr:hypothetical protein [Lachnospiraceae bacterium]